MATMSEIAERAQVSRATVSRVLSGATNVKPETRDKVMYWVKKLDFTPNLVAQGLRGSKTLLIGVLVPNLSNPFYANIVEAIEEEAAKAGYSIVLHCTHKDAADERQALSVMKGRKVDGILTIPVDSQQRRNNYADVDIPTVIFVKQQEGKSCVYASQSEAAALVARRFLADGHSQLGYVGATTDRRGQRRLKLVGYEQAIADKGLSLCDLIECDQSESIDDRSAYDAVRSYVREHGLKSTALFAHNDLAARDTVAALASLDLRVPQDVCVFGCDNTILATKASPQLSSVDHPLHEMGVQALKLLAQKIESGSDECVQVKLSSKLVVRASSMRG